MRVRATLLALGALLAFTSGADAQARPPAQKTGPITIFGTGSTGDVSTMSVAPNPALPANTLARTVSDLQTGKLAVDPNNNVNIRGFNSASDGTASFSMKPFWAFYPNFDLIRYNNAIGQTTKYDGSQWESALGVDFQSTTGYSKPWASGATVALGDNLTASAGNPQAYTYRVTKAGTLGTTSPTAGPGSAVFNDGTAQLQWINFTNLAAKIGLTSTTFASGNAGNTWGVNFNYQMRPMSHQPQFMSGIEQDYYNYSGYNCDLFTGNTCNGYNLYLGGTNRSTVGMNIGKPDATQSFATEWALAIQGPYLARDAAIEINTTAGAIGIGIGRYANVLGTSTYSFAAFRDESTTPRGVSLGGIYSDSAINTVDAVGGDNVALRMRNGQLQCWGTGVSACFYYNPDFGWLLSSTASPSGTKFTFSPVGNFSAVGGVNGALFSVNGVGGAYCSGAPSAGFRVQGGIVTAC